MINIKDDLGPYRTQLKELHHTLQHTVCEEKSASTLISTYTDTVDTLLIQLWQKYQVDSTRYCLLAIGGYGRLELYPYSDLDILVLSHTLIQEDTALEAFLQALWDLKLKASSVVTTLEQLSTLCLENLHTLTSIIDQRYIVGSSSLYQFFCEQSTHLFHLGSLEFYQAKKQEQQQRHHRFGLYALCLEPNIKESPGGLRDIQTLLWCFKYAMIKKNNILPSEKINFLLSELDALVRENILSLHEAKLLAKTYLHLAYIRFALHLYAKKNTDKLSFEMQNILAKHFTTHETAPQRVFMKVYYDKVLILQRYALVLEKSLLLWLNHNESSMLQSTMPPEKLALDILQNCPDEEAINHIPLMALRQLYAVTLKKEQTIDITIQSLFLNLFNKAPYVYNCLKTLHIWGLLTYYLPELQDCIGLIQHSLFHSYTVDEHTLLLTAMLDKFHQREYQEYYPLCHEIIFKVQSPQVLYLAALLHDSGKGHTEDHSLVGKRLATEVCLRLAPLLNTEEQDNLIWLVENHLLMSHVAQKQDIHDPEVVIAFAKKVKNLNRLKLLYLLTVADISATNPTLWNTWKDSLLKKLYLATEKALECDYALSPVDTKTLRKKEKTLLLLLKQSLEGADPAAAPLLWQNWPAIYFLHHSVPSIAKHTTLVLKQKKEEAIFCFSDHPKQGHYELFIYCKDRPFLFSLFTNILEKENLNIVSADILTTQDGYALDSFYLLRNQTYAQRKLHLLERLKIALHHLEKDSRMPLFSPKFHKPHLLPPMASEIHCRQKENQPYSEIEIISYDRPGLLAKIGLVFSKHQLNLEQAKIATLGQRVEDIFVLSNKDKQALSDDEVKALTQDLLEVLNLC